MSVELWCTGLLLCFLCVCVCQESDCVLGLVGRPVALPCLYPHLPVPDSFTVEWRSNNDSVVLRSTLERNGNGEMWSRNFASIPYNAGLTGNFSLELPAVHPNADGFFYTLFIVSGENQSVPVCTVCLRIAASFSSPLLMKQDAAEDGVTTFLCQSSGGYPKPAVSWLINRTVKPPEDSVQTKVALLHDSLYNVSSQLNINSTEDSTVTCSITNQVTNETVTSTSRQANGPVGKQALYPLWIFSTALCVVVGLMVMAAIAYQIHLDRLHKRRKEEYLQKERGYKRRYQYPEETEVINLEEKENDV